MDLDTTINIILTNCIELIIDNLFSVFQIIILSALSIISRVTPRCYY